MHYHLEVIIPPTNEIEKAIAEVMAPFSENCDEETSSGHSFWDWYVIGGRWAGEKVKQGIDQQKLDAFMEELKKRGVTVSGLQAGKQTLEPASQIPMVDALWRDYFPDCGITSCPLFGHSNDQYSNQPLSGDICLLSQISTTLSACRVIIAAPSFGDSGKLQAVYMQQKDFWNGVNHIESTWKGNVKAAVEMWLEKLARYVQDYQDRSTPQDDWLVVTVDYHS